MIGIARVVTRIHGLQIEDLERWIAQEWVRPDGAEGHYMFREIDVARVSLIRQLRDEMDIDEQALPVVLSLLDQLYDLRRRLAALEDRR